MRQIFSFAAAGLAAALVMSSPSEAATITMTMSGVISSGTDFSGLLGAPSGDLTGATFDVVQTFEPELIVLGPYGSEYRSIGPTTVLFTIGSHTFEKWVGGAGPLFRTAGGVTGHANGGGGGLYGSVIFNLGFQDPTFGLDETDSGPVTGAASVSIYDVQSTLRLNANLAPTHWSTTMVVPEPATWALLILGFGGVGAALRSRRGHLQAA
jgi:hypothetical protein